jgi:hypothetical protein
MLMTVGKRLRFAVLDGLERQTAPPVRDMLARLPILSPRPVIWNAVEAETWPSFVE